MANRFLIAGGDGLWNSTNNWAATSGGSAGASFPVAGDVVAFDSLSGNAPITVNVASACASLTMSGTYAGTLTFNSTLANAGAVTFVSTCTIAGTTGSLDLGVTGGTITFGGKTLSCALSFNNSVSSSWTLGTNLTVNGVVTLNMAAGGGTINGNKITCAGGLTFTTSAGSGTSSGTTKFEITAGTWQPGGAGGGSLKNNVDLAGNVTLLGLVNFNTGTLKYVSGTITTTGSTLTCSSATTLDTAGVTWASLTFSGAATYTLTSALAWSGTLIINNNGTFNGAAFTGTGPFLVGNGVTITINNTGGIVTTGTMTLPNAVATFAGTAGFTVGTLTNTALTASRIYTLTFGNTYTVTTALSNVGTTAAIRQALKSSSAGNKVVFNVGATAIQSLAYCDPTDIDSSGGAEVVSIGATITSSLNWDTSFATSSLLANLVGYWKLDEASGNALDSHDSNPLTQVGSVGTAAGKISTARDFPGTSGNYLQSAVSASLQTGDIDFTVSVWVWADTFGSDLRILRKAAEWDLYRRSSDGKFAIYITSTAATFVNSVVPVTGQWYHVIYWHNSVGNEHGISVNGTETIVSYSGGVGASATTLDFGTYGGTNLWDGRLDEAGFWKRVLTSTERTALYNGGAGLGYPFAGGAIAGACALTFGHGASMLSLLVALAGSSALAFGHGASTLTATGSLEGAAVLVFGDGTSTLTGIGTLAGAAPLTFTAALTLTDAAGPPPFADVGLHRTMEMDLLMIIDHIPRTVGYYRRGVMDTYAAAIPIHAYREPVVDGTMNAAGAVLPQGSCVFHVPARDLLPGGPPQPYDRLIDSSGAYTVDNVDNQASGTRFRLTCIPEVLGA